MAEQVQHFFADIFQLEAEIHQHLGGYAFLLTEQAQQQIQQIQAQLQQGGDFASLAKQHSDCPSASKGGDLGSFGRGQMVGPFEEAAFGASPGEIVGPVETSFGVHLIEVLGRTEGGTQPLDEVATSIRNRLKLERAQTLAENTANELAERIDREKLTDPEALRALADEEIGVTFLTTAPFGETDAIGGIGDWWSSDHTISGDARNMSIDPVPQGCFCEAIGEHAGVVHLTVTFVNPEVMLRLTGGLGPLGLMGVDGNMTWEFFDAGEATRVKFAYAVGGYRHGGLDTIAAPVDFVIGEALTRLKAHIETGNADNAG